MTFTYWLINTFSVIFAVNDYINFIYEAFIGKPANQNNRYFGASRNSATPAYYDAASFVFQSAAKNETQPVVSGGPAYRAASILSSAAVPPDAPIVVEERNILVENDV